MTIPKRGHDTVTLKGGGLGELTFAWSGDRYRHYWTIDDGDASVVISSEESNSSELWPLSPPLQQIHQQSFDDGREVIFGVGMSGRGHWSASFTLVPELKCWIVELACRSSQPPERLLSSYSLDPRWTLESVSNLVRIAANTIRLEAIASSTSATFRPQHIQLLPQQILQGAATTQWAFRLRIG